MAKSNEFSHGQSVQDRHFTQDKTMEQIVEGIVNRVLNERLSDRYLSLKEVALEFGFSRTWIYRQHAGGHLQIYKFAGKTRIKRSEILKIGIPI
jgi:predicted DNA-binding transcriptional regulator AlpA